jgi:hypothetical protein
MGSGEGVWEWWPVARQWLMALWRFVATGQFPEGAALKEA